MLNATKSLDLKALRILAKEQNKNNNKSCGKLLRVARKLTEEKDEEGEEGSGEGDIVEMRERKDIDNGNHGFHTGIVNYLFPQ